ncbi:protein phosphatase 1 regulatory subunit 15A isoform X1 [Anguilla anguilla]|uniref:protein phosphatase 1 regulatory subunit 15A isoform X1 n=1 Tax=Anguilla anguilla TaxID=7936 RepID=UPI0015A7F3E4|nr:protein phosphatase 1 regulatory subunit 15A isoform X1 [Anguilla anguilla]
MDMAPATSQSHQPLLLLYPMTYGLPMSMVRKQSLATMGMPFPREFRSAEPEKGPLGMPVFRKFRVLRRVVRCLRALLFKVLERCGGVMEVLRSAAYPASAGKDRALGPLAERDGLGPTGGAREQGRYPPGQEWNYAMDLKVLEEEVLDEEEVVWDEDEDEEEVVWDEEEVLAPYVKTMEGDDASGEEGELDLCDWLEWEPEEEESPSDLADPLDPAPEPVLHLAPCGKSAACQNSPTGLNSEGEHSESDWSDEDDDEDEEDDDDDDEWDESDDEEDDDEWDESDDEEDDDEWDESDGSSELDSELWDSFLCSGDPSNPLRLSPPAGKKGRVPETDELSSTGSFHSAEGENEGERESEGEDERAGPPQPGRKAGKKVQFSEEVEVRPLVAWAFASRAARDGSCWLQMARDRDRFRRRVQTASDIISPFLLANHRARVWERFQLT